MNIIIKIFLNINILFPFKAFCRCKNNKWFKFDDNIVTEVQFNTNSNYYDTCTNNGYLLMYVGKFLTIPLDDKLFEQYDCK